jgi:hypothetical protein
MKLKTNIFTVSLIAVSVGLGAADFARAEIASKAYADSKAALQGTGAVQIANVDANGQYVRSGTAVGSLATKAELQAIELTPGPKGDDGADGADGAPGAAATITVGTVTTGAAGANATVTNAGTANAATFNFTIPRGADGAPGADGAKGDKGDTGSVAGVTSGAEVAGQYVSGVALNETTKNLEITRAELPAAPTSMALTKAADGTATTLGVLTSESTATSAMKQKTLTAGTNVTITGTADKITIAATDTNTTVLGTAATTGTGNVVTGITTSGNVVTAQKANVTIPVGSATGTTYANIWVE